MQQPEGPSLAPPLERDDPRKPLRGRDDVVESLAQVLTDTAKKPQGHRAEAEREYRQVLERQEAVLPKDHPDIRATRSNLEALLAEAERG